MNEFIAKARQVAAAEQTAADIAEVKKMLGEMREGTAAMAGELAPAEPDTRLDKVAETLEEHGKLLKKIEADLKKLAK